MGIFQALGPRWKALWNPDMYHGWNKKDRYFEGWYFKIVDPTESFVLAIIPGISKGAGGEQHAFVQMLNGKACTTDYHTFPADHFQPSRAGFAVTIGENAFAANRLKLDLPEIKGELRFSNLHPWPKMLGAPGIMGWYSFVPFMECYHGVVSVHHRIEGQLQIKGREVSFDGGLGYTEKDWGVSFPSCWIWTQTNHFDSEEPVCLMASVAHIPWLNSHFIGYIVGFLWQGKLHRFATYTGAKMKAALSDHSVELAFKDNRYRLELTAHQAEGGNLVSPVSGNMTGRVNESMQAKVEVRFYDRDRLCFEGVGRNAGLEVAGAVEKLLTDTWRR